MNEKVGDIAAQVGAPRGVGRWHFQHGPEPVQHRHSPHRGSRPRLCHDTGAGTDTHGQEQPPRHQIGGFLQVNFQDRLYHSHCHQHLEHCHGRVRRGAERSQLGVRGHHRQYQHRHGGDPPRYEGPAGGVWPLTVCVCPICKMAGRWHIGSHISRIVRRCGYGKPELGLYLHQGSRKRQRRGKNGR